MKKTILFSILIFLSSLLLSQQTNEERDDKGSLSIDLESISFIRNNEYLNPVTEGYTMIGFFIRPAIIYSPGKKFSLELGTHISGFAGAEGLNNPQLVFSSTWKIAPKTRFIIGTLDGSDLHRMEDPLFYKEKLYTDFTENGFRFVNDYDRVFSDLWVNWENYISKGDSVRESFTAGLSFRYMPLKKAAIFSIEVPVSAIFKHYGGQISDYDAAAESYLNVSAGLRINADIADGRAGRAGVEYTQYLYTELTNSGNAGVTDGRASWIRLFYDFKYLSFCTSYWWSHDFFTPNGNPIYNSISDHLQGVIVHDREMWNNSLFVKLNPGGYFEFLAGFETWYDRGFKRLDNSLTIHLRFDKLINIRSSR